MSTQESFPPAPSTFTEDIDAPFDRAKTIASLREKGNEALIADRAQCRSEKAALETQLATAEAAKEYYDTPETARPLLLRIEELKANIQADEELKAQLQKKYPKEQFEVEELANITDLSLPLHHTKLATLEAELRDIQNEPNDQVRTAALGHATTAQPWLAKKDIEGIPQLQTDLKILKLWIGDLDEAIGEGATQPEEEVTPTEKKSEVVKMQSIQENIAIDVGTEDVPAHPLWKEATTAVPHTMHEVSLSPVPDKVGVSPTQRTTKEAPAAQLEGLLTAPTYKTMRWMRAIAAGIGIGAAAAIGGKVLESKVEEQDIDQIVQIYKEAHSSEDVEKGIFREVLFNSVDHPVRWSNSYVKKYFDKVTEINNSMPQNIRVEASRLGELMRDRGDHAVREHYDYIASRTFDATVAIGFLSYCWSFVRNLSVGMKAEKGAHEPVAVEEMTKPEVVKPSRSNQEITSALIAKRGVKKK